MHRLLVALVFSVLGAGAAGAAPDGVPARPLSIGIWNRHDPAAPRAGLEPWTTEDVAGFMTLHPGAYVELGYEDGKPPGVRVWTAWPEKVVALRAAALARGTSPDGRICVSERPDVLTRYPYNAGACNPTSGGGGCDWEGDMDGSLGEAETFVKAAGQATDGSANALVDVSQSWTPELFTHRLVVLRPRSAGEEQRRVVSNGPQHVVVDAPWNTPPQAGDRYEVRGSFDPAWVRRVPAAAHDAAIARFWTGARDVCGGLPCRTPAQPLDPFAPGNRRGFAAWVDRETIEGLRGGGMVPILYGRVADGDDDPRGRVDPYFEAAAVVMDVANPAYRAWRARYLLYKLADHGFAPGAAACVTLAYKPGLYTWHDEASFGPGNEGCSETETNAWTGPAHVCRDGTDLGGPLVPTPFRDGEYQSAVSAYLREVLSALVTNGYPGVRVITAEAPPYADRNWSILADDVRRHPRLVGEQGGWINPPLSELATLEEEDTTGPGAGDDTAGDPPAGGGEEPPGSDGGDATDPPVTDEPGSDPAPTPGATPEATPRAPAAGTSPAPAAETAQPAPRRGYMSSSGGGGGGGTIEPPDAD